MMWPVVGSGDVVRSSVGLEPIGETLPSKRNQHELIRPMMENSDLGEFGTHDVEHCHEVTSRPISSLAKDDDLPL